MRWLACLTETSASPAPCGSEEEGCASPATIAVMDGGAAGFGSRRRARSSSTSTWLVGRLAGVGLCAWLAAPVTGAQPPPPTGHQDAVLRPSGAIPQFFGISLALAAPDDAFVGSPGLLGMPGKVHRFRREMGTWSETSGLALGSEHRRCIMSNCELVGNFGLALAMGQDSTLFVSSLAGNVHAVDVSVAPSSYESLFPLEYVDGNPEAPRVSGRPFPWPGLGCSLAVASVFSERYVIVGAPGESCGASGPGGAVIPRIGSGDVVPLPPPMDSSCTAMDPQFGAALAAHGDVVAVGVPGCDRVDLFGIDPGGMPTARPRSLQT
ncbi:MAG: hypothetical protein NZ898_13015, partial [Myxococcota bacterium]|nr:hypothetical protein [Myxococcota bacterium]